jgi:hypothetical protein
VLSYPIIALLSPFNIYTVKLMYWVNISVSPAGAVGCKEDAVWYLPTQAGIALSEPVKVVVATSL